MTELRVRPAAPADFDAVAALTVDAYGADGQLSGGHGYGRVLADVATRAAAGDLLVAVDETGAVLGAVTYVRPGTRYAEISQPGEAEFRMLAVAPAAQGRGVGELLARACIERARAEGCAAVVICVRDMAATARRLYDRLGFTPLPERDWSPYAGVDLVALRLDLAGRAARTRPSGPAADAPRG
jgi:ribosomal protein S18 acetylase RimI-like enzyme